MPLTQLSGGLTPADGTDPRTFPTIYNELVTEVEAGTNAPVQSVNGSTGTVVLDHTDVGADESGAAAAAEAASVPRTSGIVIVDSATAVTRPTAEIVLWLDDDTNAIDGDLRFA